MSNEDLNNFDDKVASGAGINFLGTVGKLLFPLYLGLINHLFSPAIAGLFLLAFVVLEVIGNITVSGFNDGVVLFASRAQHGKDGTSDEGELYRVVANGFVITVALSAVLILVGQLIGPRILQSLFPDRGLWPVFNILLWTLPLSGATTILVASTKSLMLMHWEALLLNTLRPLLLVAISLAWFFSGDISATGLAWSYLLAISVTALLSTVAFGRHFSFSMLWRHMVHFRLAGDLVRFAIPQNLNMTFHRFITRIDTLMLGIFEYSEALISFYYTGAEIVGNLSQVQSSFSAAYAPVIARQHATGNMRALSESFSMVSRWAATVVFPLAFVVVFMRTELLQLLYQTTFTGNTAFMLVLVLRPVVNCGFGISGNIIVMTGHSMWNLVNSVTVAALNIALNSVFIPMYGLMGAALATALSSLSVTLLGLVELHYLLGVHSLVQRMYKPYLAGCPGSVAVVLFALTPAPLVERLIACAAALLSYAILLFALKIDSKDRKMFLDRLRRSSSQ